MIDLILFVGLVVFISLEVVLAGLIWNGKKVCNRCGERLSEQ